MPKLAYHPATWVRDRGVDQVYQALEDMSSVGWDGFEWSGPWMESHFDRVGEFRDLIDGHQLELSTYYAPNAYVFPETFEEEIEGSKLKADFAAAVGCPILLLDGGRKKEEGTSADDIAAAAAGANELGEYAKSLGMTACWHIHWGSIFELQEPLERLMEQTDPNLVKLCPDTAQMALGDFDSLDVFTRYAERIGCVHFKDLGPDRRFIELGHGTVDFPPLYEVLVGAGFEGWIIVDLDYTDLAPKDSCEINKRYLNEVLGIEGARDRQSESAEADG